jgi:hypothetical protein
MNKNAGHGANLFVTLRLETGDEVPFCIDTGTPRTLLDVSFEPKLGARRGTNTLNHFGSTYRGGIYTAPKLYLGDTQLLTASNIWTYDFKNQLTSRAGKRIRGILGMDCLRHYCIQLDFEAGKIRFLDSDKLRVKTLGKAYPIAMGGRPHIPLTGLVGGTITNSLVDTGCSFDGQVEKSSVSGYDAGWIKVPECKWDGQNYTNLNIQVGNYSYDSLGLRFLARHLVTFDFPNRTMYLKKTSAGPI